MSESDCDFFESHLLQLRFLLGSLYLQERLPKSKHRKEYSLFIEIIEISQITCRYLYFMQQ